MLESALLSALLLGAAPLAVTPQEARPADDALTVIFVGDPLDDDTHRAFAREARAIARGAGSMLHMAESRDAAALLGQLAPGFALVIAPPDTLDAGLHRSLLLASTTLDGDPFVDVAFGYLTGSTPAALRSTWERSERVRREGLRSRRWIGAFVTSGMRSTVVTVA